jgi:drug/metabolite transporter (DMT)-like permease
MPPRVSMSAAQAALLLRAMPAVFVLIWSTGFVVARFGMPHAPPFTFLAWRYVISVLAFLVWIALARATWPQGRAQWAHLAVTGILMHAGYLGGVWAAVKAGLGAGTAALIVGLQPLLTAIWMSGAGPSHRVAARQWLGLVLGLLGLLLVVWQRLGQGELRGDNLAMALFALASITAGTLYQKHFVTPCDVRSANTVQLLAAALVTLPLAWLETEAVRWHPELIGALGWSVLALTLGGSSLLYLLIQRGAATSVTSLMYLVPPCTAVLGWWLFDEAIGAVVVAGMVLAAIGVALVVREGSGARRDGAGTPPLPER